MELVDPGRCKISLGSRDLLGKCVSSQEQTKEPRHARPSEFCRLPFLAFRRLTMMGRNHR